MRSIGAVGWSYLRRRPGRSALTGAGIVLGVAMLFAVQISNGTVVEGQRARQRARSGDADVAVQVLGTAGATLPPERVAELSGLPDVESLGGRLDVPATLADGRTLSLAGADAGFTSIVPFPLREGRLPAEGAAEIVHTVGNGPGVGSTVKVRTPTGEHALSVVGVLDDSGPGSLDDGSITWSSIGTVRAIGNRPGAVSEAILVLRDGVDAEDWVEDHELDIAGVRLVKIEPFGGGGFSLALNFLAAVALFISAFLIYLTMSTAVVERTSVYGTMRAMGSTRRQVKRAVRAEAALLAVVATAVGLLVGYGLGSVLVAVLRDAMDIPEGGPTVTAANVVLAAVVGVGMATLAASVPARRAAALQPIVAMRGDIEGQGRLTRAWIPGLVLLVVGLFAISTLSGPVIYLVNVLVLFGAVLVVPPLLGPLAAGLGRVLQRLSPRTGHVTAMHLVKERSRSAYTVGLIMVVLALVLTVQMITATLQRGVEEVARSRAYPDLTVLSPNLLPPQVLDEVRATPGVARVSPVGYGSTDVVDDGDEFWIRLSVIDPATHFDVAGFLWRSGDDDSVRTAFEAGGAIVMPKLVADAFDYEVGDDVTLRTSQGPRPFRLVGLYAGVQQWQVDVGVKDGAELFGAAAPLQAIVDVADGEDAGRVAETLRRKLHAGDDWEFGGTELNVVDRRTIEDAQKGSLAFVFGIFRNVLYLALVIGLLGLANTMVVSVLQRRREIGILRALGTETGEIRRMFTIESLILVLVAFLLAIPLAVMMRISFGNVLDGLGIEGPFVLPPGALLLNLTTAAVVGVAASWFPARRAARLVVTDTLRQE